MTETKLVLSSSMPVSFPRPIIEFPKRLGQATDWGQSTKCAIDPDRHPTSPFHILLPSSM